MENKLIEVQLYNPWHFRYRHVLWLKDESNRKFLETSPAEASFVPCFIYVLRSWSSKSCLLFRIRVGGEFVGTIGATICRDESVFLGFLVGAHQYKGRGIGAIALKKACLEVKKIWGVNEIMAQAYEDNVASIKTMEKAGFKKISVFLAPSTAKYPGRTGVRYVKQL